MQAQGKLEKIYEDKVNGRNGEFTIYKLQVNGKKFATTHAPKVREGDIIEFGYSEKVNGKFVNYSIETGITKVEGNASAPANVDTNQPTTTSAATAAATGNGANTSKPYVDERQASITRQSAFNYVTALAAEILKKEAKDQKGLINTVAVIATISEPLAAYFIDGDKSQLKKALLSISPADSLPE